MRRKTKKRGHETRGQKKWGDETQDKKKMEMRRKTKNKWGDEMQDKTSSIRTKMRPINC